MNNKYFCLILLINYSISSTIKIEEKEEEKIKEINDLKPNPWYAYWSPDCCICSPIFHRIENNNFDEKEEIKIKKTPKTTNIIFETFLTTIIRGSLLNFKHIKKGKYRNFFENIIKNLISIMTIKSLFSLISGNNRIYFRYLFFFCSIMYYCKGESLSMSISVIVFSLIRIIGYISCDEIAEKFSNNNIYVKCIINGVLTYFLEVYCDLGEINLNQIIQGKLKRF